jgi:excinuclease UvrABC nuclease subunit
MQTYIGQEFLEDIDKAENPYIVDGDIIGLPFNLQMLVNKYGKKAIPDCLGIYHLFYNDQLVYIGMSKNIRGRLLCHLKDKDMPFNNVLWFCACLSDSMKTIEDVLRIEHNMIKRFKPALNSVHANCR